MNCNKCGKIMPDNMEYCKDCGYIFHYPKAADGKYRSEYEKRMEAFCQGLQSLNTIPGDAMWDSTVSRYMLTVQKARRTAEQRNLRRYFPNSFFDGLDAFMQRCTKKEFHIALVGAIKAGKSTLINALLDRELASVSVTPETASLTKFRSSKSRDYIRVRFFNAKEWEELWKSAEDANAKVFIEEYRELNADSEKELWVDHADTFEEFDNEDLLKESIKKWTSSKCPTHYFVKEVEVGLISLDIPEQIVYVDTPGLDDPVEYRSDITRKYIDRANVVLVCVRAAALTGQELQTIYRVFANTRYNPQKVFVLGTQIDSLNDIEDEWKQQRKEWLKHLAAINCYNSKELAEKNLMPMAAFLYTLLKKYRDSSLDKKEKLSLLSTALKLEMEVAKSEDYDKMVALSGIIQLRDRINKDLLADANRIMLLDIKEKYKICKKEVFECFHGIKISQIDLIDMADRSVEEILRKLEDSQKTIEENKAEKAEFDKTLNSFKAMAEKRKNELFSVVRSLSKEK